MSISYSNEKKAWDLSALTQEETDLILKVGADYLLMVLGYQILKKSQEHAESEVLNAIPKSQMGQA